MFSYSHLNIGPLLPKQTHSLEYPYSGITVVGLHGTCACSELKNDELNSKVRVKFTAKDIPVHLIYKGGYTSEQTITVKYYITDPNNVLETKLTFKAVVHDGQKR